MSDNNHAILLSNGHTILFSRDMFRIHQDSLLSSHYMEGSRRCAGGYLKNNKTFETEVKLMTLRTGEETLIEPHAFNKDEFEINSPIVYQIIKSGLRLNF